jgi:hypothetical protein
MKKYLYIVFVAAALLMASCNDFMDVESRSKTTEEAAFTTVATARDVVAAIYASLLSGELYGEKYFYHYALNSDVEFSTFDAMIKNVGGNDFKCFDGEASSGDAAKTWQAFYRGVERANIAIYGIENSELYKSESTSEDDKAALDQLLGEAKTLRAMLMHDVVVFFGDVPFPTVPSFHRPEEEQIPSMRSREDILAQLIDDVKAIAPKMLPSSQTTIERASQEFAYAMIARMALTRAGYSLRPDKENPTSVGTMQRPADYLDYYAVAMEYAGKLIDLGTHTLNGASFAEVFVKECNYELAVGGDPIFEIPFTKGINGTLGYRTGPRGRLSPESVTTQNNVWGESGGNIKLNSFYRYSFDENDLRLDATVGMWDYDYNGTPIIIGTGNDYGHYANKWSKFWATPSNAMGVASKNDTGINFPYMRYADVLLMYAEAVNEVENGVSGANGAKAQEALKQVRRRAFPAESHGTKVDGYVATAGASKESFFQAIFNERKWEFGGEAMRWKDLVRWNLYAKVVYEVFWDYYKMGAYKNGEYLENWEYYANTQMFPDIIYYNNPSTLVVANPGDVNVYQNLTLPVLDIRGLHGPANYPGTGYASMEPFKWGTADAVYPDPRCCYSLKGYIRGGREANHRLFNPQNLPPVRYILPIPFQVITLAQGKEGYVNYYGY